MQLQNVHKAFKIDRKTDYPVLKGIDLQLKPTEFVALMGPSGSGKSTLLNLIGALIPATSGSIKVNGKELTEMDRYQMTLLRRNDIGWIFQDFALVNELTALENVLVPMHFAGNTGLAATERAIMLLNRVGLGDRLDHFPAELSSGQQQRVSIARALANDPQIILADEPTGNLDSVTGRGIIELFTELAAEGKAILMVTHDSQLAHASQKVYILRQGKLVEEISGKQEEI